MWNEFGHEVNALYFDLSIAKESYILAHSLIGIKLQNLLNQQIESTQNVTITVYFDNQTWQL